VWPAARERADLDNVLAVNGAVAGARCRTRAVDNIGIANNASMDVPILCQRSSIFAGGNSIITV